jgi:hypothetical protein
VTESVRSRAGEKPKRVLDFSAYGSAFVRELAHYHAPGPTDRTSDERRCRGVTNAERVSGTVPAQRLVAVTVATVVIGATLAGPALGADAGPTSQATGSAATAPMEGVSIAESTTPTPASEPGALPAPFA